MQRLFNALVAAAYNAVNNSLYKPFFVLIDLLYRWALGASPALYADAVSVANIAGATYDNGSSGVGATLTKNTAGAFPTTDGVTAAVGQLYLLTAQSTALQNGLYKLTTLGSSSVAWVLTRVAAWDASAEMKNGSIFYIRQGTTYGGTVWANTTASSPTVGVTSITIAQDSLLRAAVAATIVAITSFAVGTLRIMNSAGTFGSTLASSATAARTVTLPDATFTVAQAAAQTGVPSATAAPTFTGTDPTGMTSAFTGTGQSSAGQVITTTDNQTMTLNQCAGMWFISATHGPYYIVSNTAVSGAPAVLTVIGTAPTTDAGAYRIVRPPTPAGTISAVPTAAHTHAQS